MRETWRNLGLMTESNSERHALVVIYGFRMLTRSPSEEAGHCPTLQINALIS